MKFCVKVCLFVGLFSLFSNWAFAEPLDINEAYRLAALHSPQLKIQDFAVIAAQEQVSEAKYYWAPKFSFSSKFGPMPKEKDINQSIDDIWDNIGGDWGFTARSSFEFWIPLFTSLKVYNTRQLAEIGLEAEQIRAEGEALRVQYDVARAFYGLQLANAGLHVIEEAESYINKIEREYESLMEKGHDSVKTSDRYRIDIAKAKFFQLKDEILASRNFAENALALHTGLTLPITVEEMDFMSETVDLVPQDTIIALTQTWRTELRLLKKAEEAAEKQAHIQWLQWWPDLVLGGEAYFKFSNAVPPIEEKNFYVSDSYNGAGFYAGFVLRWNVDPVSQVFKVRRANALTSKTQAQRQLAIAGIELEMKKLYDDTLNAARKVQTVKLARRSAKRFLTQELLDYESGEGEAKDLISALTTYLELRSYYLYALHDLRVILVKLQIQAGVPDLSQILEISSFNE